MLKRVFVFAIVSALLLMAASAALAKSVDIIKMHKDIEIAKGSVANDVVAIGGSVTVLGRVEGNVVAIGGSIILKPNSSVAGQVVAVGGEVVKDPQAAIGGKVTQIDMPRFIPSFAGFLTGGWMALWATISILVLLGFLGLAVLLAALIPDNMGRCVNALERSFAAALLYGILWLILIVPIAVFLAISLIGIILIPLEILLVVLALIIGYIATAIFVGKNIILSLKKVSPPFLDAVLGILILFLIGFVPLIGPILKALFLIAGFGAVVTTRFGTSK